MLPPGLSPPTFQKILATNMAVWVQGGLLFMDVGYFSYLKPKLSKRFATIS